MIQDTIGAIIVVALIWFVFKLAFGAFSFPCLLCHLHGNVLTSILSPLCQAGRAHLMAQMRVVSVQRRALGRRRRQQRPRHGEMHAQNGRESFDGESKIFWRQLEGESEDRTVDGRGMVCDWRRAAEMLGDIAGKSSRLQRTDASFAYVEST